MHIYLALSPRDSEQRLFVPLGDAVDDGLSLILQGDRVVVVSIGVLRVDHHLPRASLLRCDFEGLLLRVGVVTLVLLIRRQDSLREAAHILGILSRAETAAICAVFHLLLGEDGLIVLLWHLVARLLDYGVQ